MKWSIGSVENLKIGLTSTTLKCLEKLYSQTSEYNLFSIVSIGLGIRSSISHSVSVCCLERGRSFLLSRKLRHRFARIRRFLLRVIVLRSGFLGGGRWRGRKRSGVPSRTGIRWRIRRGSNGFARNRSHCHRRRPRHRYPCRCRSRYFHSETTKGRKVCDPIYL